MIRFTVLRSKARNNVAKVSLVELRVFTDLTGEEALAQQANGTNPMPSSSSVGMTSALGSLHHSEYSLWSTATG
jgi:hypothetical protein